MDFDNAGHRYKVLHQPQTNRLQLWCKPAEGGLWRLEHAKPIPTGMTVRVARELMRQYVIGQIDYETYHRILPGK